MGEMEEEDPLCQPRRGKAERRKSNNVNSKPLYKYCTIRNSITAVKLSFSDFCSFFLFLSFCVLNLVPLRIPAGHSEFLQIVY